MGHQPGSGNGFVAPDRNCRKGTPPQRGKLFIDFLLSKEGQQTVLAIGRTPARPGIDNKMQAKNLKLFPIPPEIGDDYNRYQKEFHEIFRH